MNNNEKKELSSVFQDVFTTEDLYSFYKEIDQCISLLFQAAGKIEDAFNNSFNSQRKDAILIFLKQEGVDTHDPGKIQEKLQEIKRKGKDFPKVTLKLGYDPTRNHLETFSNWFVTRMKEKVIMEVLVERNLLGGAYITYNGRFKDYSLKSKLQSVFTKEDFTKRSGLSPKI